MNFILHFSRECLKYKAFGKGPFLLQKYIILQKVGKNKYHSDIEVHDMNRERFNMFR